VASKMETWKLITTGDKSNGKLYRKRKIRKGTI
jgi:hypothetical protein